MHKPFFHLIGIVTTKSELFIFDLKCNFFFIIKNDKKYKHFFIKKK